MAGFGFSASSDMLTVFSRSLGPACGFDRTVELRCVHSLTLQLALLLLCKSVPWRCSSSGLGYNSHQGVAHTQYEVYVAQG